MSRQIERKLLAPPAFCMPPAAMRVVEADRSTAVTIASWITLTIALSIAPSVDAAQQSALDTAGFEAERVATLFWIMAAGALLIWLLVVGLALHAGWSRQQVVPSSRIRAMIVGGGVLLPLLVLTPLLVYGLSLMSTLRAQPASVEIDIAAERWWWRVTYRRAGAEPVVLANELRLPVGESVALTLSSTDVIHALWIPALGGKLDMIPGRTTELRLEPTRSGLFRGVCAEYCGSAHAQMAFMVEVMERPQYDQWLSAQAAPARPPASAQAIEGQRQFQRNGCGGCHAIRGTAADGIVGPDLTHLGSRHSLAAAALDNDEPSLRRWLRSPHDIKPDALMPSFAHLPATEIESIGAYLRGLQ